MEKRASELIGEHVLGASSVREWGVGYETGTGRDSKATRGRVAIPNITKRQLIAALQNIQKRRETRRTPHQSDTRRVAIQNISKRQ